MVRDVAGISGDKWLVVENNGGQWFSLNSFDWWLETVVIIANNGLLLVIRINGDQWLAVGISGDQ